MRDDQLKKLLAAVEPLGAGRLACRTTWPNAHGSCSAHRQGRRIVAVAAPLALAVLLAVAWRLRGLENAPSPNAALVARAHDRPTHGADSGDAPALLSADEMSRLTAEAEFHEGVARQIVALAKRDRNLGHAREALSAPQLQESVREQLETVAYRMILEADALRAAMRGRDDAVAIYRRVLRLFPDTNSAAVARERLADHDAAKGAT